MAMMSGKGSVCVRSLWTIEFQRAIAKDSATSAKPVKKATDPSATQPPHPPWNVRRLRKKDTAKVKGMTRICTIQKNAQITRSLYCCTFCLGVTSGSVLATVIGLHSIQGTQDL